MGFLGRSISLNYDKFNQRKRYIFDVIFLSANDFQTALECFKKLTRKLFTSGLFLQDRQHMYVFHLW